MDRKVVLEEIDVVKRMRLVQQRGSWQLDIAPIRTKECDTDPPPKHGNCLPKTEKPRIPNE